MAKLEDVISQISSQITKYTDSFNDFANVDSVSISGTTITVEVDTEIEKDTVVNIREVYVKNNAVSASAGDTSGTYIVELEQEHDITYSEIESEVGVVKEVTFEGDFEGDYVLTEVPELNQITIESSSAPTGSYYILEAYNLSGRKNVVWTSDTSFTYESDYTLEPVSASGTVQSNIRITGVSSDQDIVDLLENKSIKLTKNTMFVTIGDTKASKSRFTYSDSFNRKGYGEDLHIEVTQDFSVYMVLPTHTKTTPRDAINELFTLRPYLVKSLQGALFDSGFFSSNKFLCVYLSDSGESYNKAYYVHRFDFETVFNIESDDCLDIGETRAFKSFVAGFKLSYDDYEDEKKSIQDNLL